MQVSCHCDDWCWRNDTRFVSTDCSHVRCDRSVTLATRRQTNSTELYGPGFVIRAINIYSNLLTGTLPTSANLLTRLSSLNVAGNQLTGTLPDFSPLSSVLAYGTTALQPSHSLHGMQSSPLLSAFMSCLNRGFSQVPENV